MGYYDPTLIPVAQQLSADELGQYLMFLTVPEPLKEYMLEETSFVIQQAKSVTLEKFHILVNRVMILGLANFTTGKTKQFVSQMLKQAQLPVLLHWLYYGAIFG